MLDVGSGQGAARDNVRLALFIAGLVIAAIAFLAGAIRKGAQAALDRMLYGTHFAVVFFGSSIALLVIVVVALSHIH